ncbi:MAG: hypothetical protein KatS3mg110_0286 [Pirellulaceae bacterium]|nr:MAG: hypothetical protein KatS3mg110_0286 [Pirellulaceae bacterium]
MLDEWLAEQLEIFFGRATEVVTDVYVRLPRRTPQDHPLELAGWIQGPFCEGVRTLPGKTRFVDLGSGPTYLARASVPDLAFWSPGQPYRYRVTAELHQSGQCVARTSRWWGCHRLSVAGQHILQGPRPIPLVAVHTAPDAIDWQLWSSMEVAALIEDPKEDLLFEADRHGVPVVCYTDQEGDELLRRARRWARHPAAWLLVAHSWPTTCDPIQLTPNLIWARWYQDAGQYREADVPAVVIEEQVAAQLTEREPSRPIVIARRCDNPLSDVEQALRHAAQWRKSWEGRWAGFFLW